MLLIKEVNQFDRTLQKFVKYAESEFYTFELNQLLEMNKNTVHLR